MKEHVEAARRTLNEWRNDDVVNMVGDQTFIHVDTVIRKLDRAGLLRTGIEQRAVEACEGYATAWGTGLHADTTQIKAVLAVGRESLALKQPPKPPQYEPWLQWGLWFARRPAKDKTYDVTGSFPDKAVTEKVCAILNACDTETRDA